jgi:predicted nicotinamide N-methyase
MIASSVLQNFDIGPHHLLVYALETNAIQNHYLQVKKDDPSFNFPYWSQVWPAALGLCQFLVHHTHYVQDKKVVELAAGLGLPSLLAAQYAREVIASDHIPDAVRLMERSTAYNGIMNMQCALLDWSNFPETIIADTLLLSDINYDPVSFDAVYSLLQRFLTNGATILLSTPQRLMAKPFIDRILPFCIEHEEVLIENAQRQTLISVFVLKKVANDFDMNPLP